MADLFADYTRPRSRGESRRGYTMPLSILAHAGIIGLAIVAPLVAADRLPSPRVVLGFAAVEPPQVPKLPAIAPSHAAPVTSLPREVSAIPTEAPTAIRPEAPVPPALGVAIGAGSDLPGGIGIASPAAFAPPPLTPAKIETPIRPGGRITPPTRVRYVQPDYPVIAITAKVSGVVVIDATIDAEGNVVNTAVIRSVPLLDAAAVAAVRQWKYTPTMLNGQAVPVLLTVTVVFTLK